MAGQPFDRTIVYPLERPLADDINSLQSTADLGLRRLAVSSYDGVFRGANPLGGFIGGSMRVVPTSPASTSVAIVSGIALYDDVANTPTAIGGVVGLDDTDRIKPISLGGFGLGVAIPAPPGSNSRIDLIEIKYGRRVVDPTSRDVFDESIGDFIPSVINKTLSFAIGGADLTYNGSGLINYKTGTVAGSPVAPAVTAGYLAVATIRVATGATAYDADVITDERQVGFANSVAQACARFVIGPGSPGLISVATPPGISLYVTYTGGDGFEMFVIGNLRASSLALAISSSSFGQALLVTSVTTTATVIDAGMQTSIAAGTNLMGSAKVAVGQKVQHSVVVIKQQKGSSPFGFDQALAADITVQLTASIA